MKPIPLLLAVLLMQSLAAQATPPLPTTKPGPDWKIARNDRDMVIFFRDSGSNAREMKVFADINAPPQAVFNAVTDFEHYTQFMPYAKESKVMRVIDATSSIVYSLSAPPLIAQRDLVEQVTMTRGSPENGGVFRSEWVAKPELTPTRNGVVRIRLSTGSWSLEPLDRGQTTRVTYSILTDPGGKVPKAFADGATNAGMDGLMKAIRKRVTGHE
jgi:carbon monoxide dehydrogenase subunit G